MRATRPRQSDLIDALGKGANQVAAGASPVGGIESDTDCGLQPSKPQRSKKPAQALDEVSSMKKQNAEARLPRNSAPDERCFS